MILKKETFEKFEYYPEELNEGSHGKIIVKCDKCGKIRTNEKRYYSSLCHTCAMGTDAIRKKKSDSYKGLTTEQKRKRSESHMGKKHSEETKQKIGDAHRGKKRGKFSDEWIENIRKASIGRKHTDESKKKMSEAHKGKYCGEDSWMWEGGKSFEPYCIKFNDKIKENVRNQYNRKCFLCKKDEIENGRKLDVHHIDYDKQQGCEDKNWVLVPLCISCHSKTNSNRDYWEILIMNKLKSKGEKNE